MKNNSLSILLRSLHGRGLPWSSVSPIALLLCLFFAADAGAQAPAESLSPVYVFAGSPEVPGAGSGYALSSGDVTGDGWQDVIVGSYGRVRVFSGKTGQLWLDVSIDPSAGFGRAVASAGDVNGDGHDDIVVGAEGSSPSPGKVYVLSGKDGSILYVNSGTVGHEQLGRAVTGGIDLDGDGIPDFVAGGEQAIRAYSGATGSEIWSLPGVSGTVLCLLNDTNGDGFGEVVTAAGHSGAKIFSGIDGSVLLTIPYPDQQSSFTYFGWAVANVGDIDGDGIEDFAVSAPGSSSGGFIDNGRVDVYSGADASLILSVHGIYMYKWLGRSLAGIGDVDGDGVPDFMAGFGGWDPGVQVFSGATGTMIYELRGMNYSTVTYPNFGSALTGIGDLNGDGNPDFAVGYDSDHTYGTFAGSVYVYLSGSTDPITYCQAKPNSVGCTPVISSSGLLSLSVGDAFHVTASKVVNQQVGLLAWASARANEPFAGGTLCLRPPIVRTSIQHSGGNLSGTSCTGAYSFHFSQAYAMQWGLQPGSILYAQYWQRDPGHPDGTGVGLTAGLTFLVHP